MSRRATRSSTSTPSCGASSRGSRPRGCWPFRRLAGGRRSFAAGLARRRRSRRPVTDCAVRSAPCRHRPATSPRRAASRHWAGMSPISRSPPGTRPRSRFSGDPARQRMRANRRKEPAMDVLDKCREFTLAREAMAAGVYPFFTSFESNDGATARHGGRGMVMCGSNNYLGLTNDTRVLEASRMALERLGSSCTGSRLNNGNLRLHEELERQLADFFAKPAALVFSTGYHANVGTVSALLSPSDVAILDREVHASVFDGCRMSGAPTRFFAHNDPDDLAAKLSLCRAQAGKLV